MAKGTLFLVATPIGNLEEITPRAIKTLREVNYIYAEDTRVSIKLLTHYNITTPLRSLYLKQMVVKTNEIINHLLNGCNVAIISDAGVPLISDPGFELTQLLPQDIKISPIGIPNAAISALIASRLPANPFLFLGFLPRKKEKGLLINYLNFKGTIILYESPLRIINTLKIIKDVFNEVKVALAKEITKLHEEIITANISDVIANISEPKGEYVIIIYNNPGEENIDINNLIEKYLSKNYSTKEIIKLIKIQTKYTHSQIYDLIIKRRPHEK